jgi:hypothetical protein
VKIGVYDKDILKGYIGVVDMAGNEDPYDIAASICPTMEFSKMDSLLKNPEFVVDFDILYQEVLNALLEILKPTIIKKLFSKYLEFVPKNILPQVTSKIFTDNLNDKKQPRLYAMKMAISPSTIPTPQPTNLFIQISETADKQSQSWMYINKLKKTNEDKDPKHKEKIEILSVRTAGNPPTCNVQINAKLLQEICIYILNEIEQGNAVYDINENVTINDIRMAILQGKTTEVKILKFRYVYHKLKEMKDKYGEEPIIDLGITFNTSLAKLIRNPKTSQEALNSIVQSVTKSYNDYIKANEYLFPFTPNGGNEIVKYKYETIARIIKEGYYINKANAELMDYFYKKLNMQLLSTITYNKKDFTFDNNFAFTSYDKFRKTFNSIQNPQQDATNIQNYDTKLVESITKTFPGKNKDIIFACVRNDKDFGKILGAIETLKLIKDLKST